MSNENLQPIHLVNCAAGVYIPQQFCAVYSSLITNGETLKEDIVIVLLGPNQETEEGELDYWEAWENLLSNVELSIEDKKYHLNQGLYDGSDLWAVPEGYEYPED